MGITLLLHDQTASGATTGRSELPIDEGVGEMTVRELIRRRVRAEVEAFNQRDEVVFRGLVQPGETERTLNGFRMKRHRAVDAEEQCRRALEAFERNGFFLLVGDRQVESLDEVIPLRDGLEVEFLRLVPLVGG